MSRVARAMTIVAAAMLLGGGTLTSVSCSNCSVGGQDPVRFEDGITNGSGTVYQSTTPTGEMLHFPQGRTYQFVHGLGTTPYNVDIFLSFRDRLTDDDSDDDTEPNNVAPSAGNTAVIEVWNDEIIQIRNDTCENNFHVRVVAQAEPADSESIGGAAGASSQ